MSSKLEAERPTHCSNKCQNQGAGHSPLSFRGAIILRQAKKIVRIGTTHIATTHRRKLDVVFVRQSASCQEKAFKQACTRNMDGTRSPNGIIDRGMRIN
jgi:hypothetical protein